MMQNAYSNQCLSRAQRYDWFKRFKDGWLMSVEDGQRSGRLSISTDGVHMAKVNEILRTNRRPA